MNSEAATSQLSSLSSRLSSLAISDPQASLSSSSWMPRNRGAWVFVRVKGRDPDLHATVPIGPSVSLLFVTISHLVSSPPIPWHSSPWNEGPRRSDSLSCFAKHHSAPAEVMFTYMIFPCHLKYVMDTVKTIGIFKLQCCAPMREIFQYSYWSLIGIILLMIE